MSYNMRRKIASYFHPGDLSGKTIHYVMRNRNLRRSGQLENVYADPSPVKNYGWL